MSNWKYRRPIRNGDKPTLMLNNLSKVGRRLKPWLQQRGKD